MGGAIASKWVGVYALGAIGLVVLWDLFSRGKDGIAGLAGPVPVSLAVGGFLLLVVPLGVYLASYAPYYGLGHGFADLIGLQKQMYGYHAHLTATHPYGSPWYGWIVGRRPVWLYLGPARGALRSEIWTIANPIVLVGGLVGLILLARAAVKSRAVGPAVVILAAAAQFVPWMLISRVTFLYHFLPEIPMLAIGLAWWLGVGRKTRPGREWFLGIAVGAFVAIVAFVLTLPVIDGWYVTERYLTLVKDRWLFWMF